MKPNYFDLSTEHKRVYRARKKLGDELIIQFFRSMREQPDTYAITIINQDLDEGQTLDDIFYSDNKFGGYYLSAKDLDKNVVELTFGFQAGGLAGDGNSYDLVFLDDGSWEIHPGFPWMS